MKIFVVLVDCDLKIAFTDEAEAIGYANNINHELCEYARVSEIELRPQIDTELVERAQQ